MLKKRMLSPDICESDAFIMIPLSAHGLYMHLCLHADDDGVVNNTKSIMAMVGATQNDFDWLVDKEFIIDLQEQFGVIVIKHWRMHNWLIGDRYTPSNYLKVTKAIFVKQKGQYTLDKRGNISLYDMTKEKTRTKNVSRSVSENGSPVGTLVESSVVKVSKEEKRKDLKELKDIPLSSIDSKGYSSADADEPEDDPINYKAIIDRYNAICTALPRANLISDKRRKAIRARIKQGYTIDQFQKLFEKAQASTFLTGGNRSDWVADFDWLMCDANIAKTLDGKYDNREGNASVPEERELTMEELEIELAKYENPKEPEVNLNDLNKVLEKYKKKEPEHATIHPNKDEPVDHTGTGSPDCAATHVG